MSKAQVIKRVNTACNFWADTFNEDYCECLSWEEVKETDKDNKEVFFMFKKELGACGY